MFWNVRGLGNLAKQQMIAEVIHNYKVDIVYLEETKLTNPQ